MREAAPSRKTPHVQILTEFGHKKQSLDIRKEAWTIMTTFNGRL